MSFEIPALSLLETRVLGVLVEKQHTVPDAYPLTLNALVAGCNQKTSRDPMLDASEAEVQAAVDHLRTLSLIVESSGGRVMRYAHNVERVLAVPSQSVALLAALMLRGPQTVERAAHRTPNACIASPTLLRSRDSCTSSRAGRRERSSSNCRGNPARAKRAGCICCPARPPSMPRRLPSPAMTILAVSEVATLKANLARVEDELDALKIVVAKLCAELGIR